MGGILNLKINVTDSSGKTIDRRWFFDILNKHLTARKELARKTMYAVGVGMVNYARGMIRRNGWYMTASLHNSIRLIKVGQYSYEWRIGGINPGIGTGERLSYPKRLNLDEPSNSKGKKKTVNYALVHEFGLFPFPISEKSRNPLGRPKTIGDRPVIRSTANWGVAFLRQKIKMLMRAKVRIGGISEGIDL